MKNKKNNELYALEKAIQIGNSKHSVTKKIASRLSGDFIYREIEERPDFVKKTFQNDRRDECIVGIEHFRGDHLSLQKKDGRVGSTGIMHNIESKSVFNRWNSKIGESPEIDLAAINDIQNLIWNQFKRVNNTDYPTFISSFKYSLNKHMAKVESYREELKKIANGKKIELAFLIEVHSEFKNKYLTNKRGTKKSLTGIMPMFNDVVEMLERIDSKEVDYIILLLCETQINENTDVIAFKTGDIYKQLINQKKYIYEYAGKDFFKQAFSGSSENLESKNRVYHKDDDIIMDFNYDKFNQDDRQQLEDIFRCCERVRSFEKQGKNYITDVSVQAAIDIYREIIFENRSISKDIIKERENEFFNKYLN